MRCQNLIVSSVLGLFIVAGTIAIAQQAKEPAAAPGAKPEMKLPPGWTEDDVKACMVAGTPGEKHKDLAKGAGTWQGKTTMWMFPGSEPMKSECVSKATSILDGRYIRVEITGEMPGMGPFNGIGVYGYDNVSGKYVSTWIDNHSTGILNGTGEVSADGKVMTWSYTYNCPVTKKPATLREVETITGSNTRTLEMFGKEPKSGKEYKMMSIEFTKQ